MNKGSLFGLSTGAVLLVTLSVAALVWSFEMFPPAHPRQRELLRYAAGLAFAGVAVAAWAHGRAARARDTPGKWLAVLAFIVGGVLCVMAYLFSTVNSHSAPRNEAMAIGDMRTFLAAQTVYASVNGGNGDGNLQCLAVPTDCLPAYPADGPYFLDPEMAALSETGGYRRSFHAGPPPDAIPPNASPTSVTTWAYLAVPVEIGYTGGRGFCGDSRGALCFTRDGTAPPRQPDGCCDLTHCEELD